MTRTGDDVVVARVVTQSATPSAEPVLDVVRAHPLCAQTPWPVLQHAITPAESVYVRSNFETPQLGASHVVRVLGAVSAPRSFSLSQLAALPQHDVTVTMECAGNWRLGMDPVPPGEPWAYGAVSTTSWRGVRLRDVLQQVGVLPEAVELKAVGADSGPRDDAEGVVRFERSMPLDVAWHEDTLLATHMDGTPLTLDHGAPLRLIVPRWYGMANVKWVEALELITTPFTGYFQRQRYVYDTPQGITPVATARVKSMITFPVPELPCAPDCVVRGWAWSGDGAITRVQVAVNDTWYDAELGTPVSAYAWTPFVCALTLPVGAVTLHSRATDSSGATQPDRIAWNTLGYGNNAVRAMPVVVLG